MITTCTVETPLGHMTAAAENQALTGLWFQGQKYFPNSTRGWVESPDEGIFIKLRDWLGAYFAGRAPITEVPLAPRGTPFQQSIWNKLVKIKPGQMVTYGHLARELAVERGLPSMSAQAVGGAVGHNPISILIPCHRVVGHKGSLTGYAGGLDRKRALLHLEKAL